MSKMSQHIISKIEFNLVEIKDDPSHQEWSEKLSLEDREAQDQASREQEVQPITGVPF